MSCLAALHRDSGVTFLRSYFPLKEISENRPELVASVSLDRNAVLAWSGSGGREGAIDRSPPPMRIRIRLRAQSTSLCWNMNSPNECWTSLCTNFSFRYGMSLFFGRLPCHVVGEASWRIVQRPDPMTTRDLSSEVSCGDKPLYRGKRRARSRSMRINESSNDIPAEIQRRWMEFASSLHICCPDGCSPLRNPPHQG